MTAPHVDQTGVLEIVAAVDRANSVRDDGYPERGDVILSREQWDAVRRFIAAARNEEQGS